MDNFKLRLRFSKFGNARFISHLDLMATLQRALIRAGIKLKYTQGFNPHPSISVALPLSVGHLSFCELVDFKTEDYLLPDGLPKIINDVLPDGIEVLDAYFPMRKFDKISWIEIKFEFFYDDVVQNVSGDLARRFAMDSIIINKKSKRGIKEINIAPYIKDMCYNTVPAPKCSDGEGHRSQSDESLIFERGLDGFSPVIVVGKVSANDPSINPSNLIDALSGEYEKLAPSFARYTRLEIYDDEMEAFM